MVAQGEATRLRSLVRQREADVEQINGVVGKLNRERENISDIVRQEFADRYISKFYSYWDKIYMKNFTITSIQL